MASALIRVEMGYAMVSPSTVAGNGPAGERQEV